MITIRPATRADMAALDGVPPGKSARVLAAEEDGEVVGIWGIYTQETRYVLFSNLTPRFRANRRNFVHGIASVHQLLSGRPALPVIAEADPEIPGSEVLLQHMGFTRLHDRVFQR